MCGLFAAALRDKENAKDLTGLGKPARLLWRPVSTGFGRSLN